MGKPLVRFCEGQEFNCDMEQILWHRRESRRKQRKQTWSYSHGSLLSTRNLFVICLSAVFLAGCLGIGFCIKCKEITIKKALR